MRTLLPTAVLAAFALASPPAYAQDKLDCKTAFTTVDLNACAEIELETADAALNAAYRQALAKIKKHDHEKPYDAKAYETAFRAAQRAWIAYRDADCKGVVPFIAGGGTATTGEILGCLTDKTKARTAEIMTLVEAP
jgi:uncharacterized protein YecT (DUF1311 family)